MPDLALGTRRPFTLVTTATRRGHNGKTRSAQIDIHVTSADLRIRFTDFDTLQLFRQALDQLSNDLDLPDPFIDRPVMTRVYSEQEAWFAS
jgi:hypothetical protein